MSEEIIGQPQEAPQEEQPKEEKELLTAEELTNEYLDLFKKRRFWYHFFQVGWIIVTINIVIAMVAWAVEGRWMYVINNAAWLMISLLRVYDQRLLGKIAATTVEFITDNLALHRLVELYKIKAEHVEEMKELLMESNRCQKEFINKLVSILDKRESQDSED